MVACVVVVAIGPGIAIVVFIIGVGSSICIMFILSVVVGETGIVVICNADVIARCMVRLMLCGG